MDEYLESLVKKSDFKETEEKLEKVEEVKEADPVEEAATVEEVIAAPEPVEETKPEPKSEKQEEKKTEKKSEKKSANGPLVLGQEYTVGPIRVYKTPDRRQVSQIIEGKVVYIGQSGAFSLVKYMRYGFGLVPGYVEDLESAIK